MTLVSLSDRYELLDDRRCVRCSTDDPSYGGFELRDGRLVCKHCRDTMDSGDLPYVRAVSAYRATMPGPDWREYRRRAQAYWDVRDFKAENRADRLPFLAAAMREAVTLLAAQVVLPETTVVVPLPNHDPAKDHAARIVEAAEIDLPICADLLRCVKSGSLRAKHLNREARYAERRDAYVSSDDLQGITVVVADDLFASGSTLYGASRACLAAGVDAVYCVTAARQVQPDRGDTEINGTKIRMFRWNLVPTSGVVGCGSATQIRIRFTCRTCPHRIVTSRFAFPATDEPMACPECHEVFLVTVEKIGGSAVRLFVTDTKATDLQVDFA